MTDSGGAGARPRAEEGRRRALALLETGAFAEALATYDDALQAARQTGDDPFVDWIYACRAAAAAEAGPADEELLELKRILLRAPAPATAFRAAYTTARIYEIRRDYKKAVAYNARARASASALAEPLLLATSEAQLGTSLVADSRFEEAAGAYRRALETADGAELSPVWRAIWRDNLGYCLMALDQTREGIELVHSAFDDLEARDAKSFTVIPLLDLCFGYLKCDRYAEARYFGESSLERLPLAAEEAAVEKNLLYLLGETCHLSGDSAAAQSYFDRLARHYPEFRNLRAYLEVFDFRNVINLRS